MPDHGERLLPSQKLRRRASYLECYRRGCRVEGPMATLFVLDNGGDQPRLGITASRKLGSAVVRNRIRRRTREIFRRWKERTSLPAVDIVVNLRHPAVTAEFEQLQQGLERQLRKVAAGMSDR